MNDREPNNVEYIIRFYVTNDFGNILEHIKNDSKLDSYVISSVNNISSSNDVIII
jgi:hypothetical protein